MGSRLRKDRFREDGRLRPPYLAPPVPRPVRSFRRGTDTYTRASIPDRGPVHCAGQGTPVRACVRACLLGTGGYGNKILYAVVQWRVGRLWLPRARVAVRVSECVRECALVSVCICVR